MEAEYPTSTIFQLGSLLVFWRPTTIDLLDGRAPYGVFWTDIRSGNQYGPFANTYEGMRHYTWFVSMQLPNIHKQAKLLTEELNKPSAPVIHVNFNSKQIVKYSLPGEDDV